MHSFTRAASSPSVPTLIAGNFSRAPSASTIMPDTGVVADFGLNPLTRLTNVLEMCSQDRVQSTLAAASASLAASYASDLAPSGHASSGLANALLGGTASGGRDDDDDSAAQGSSRGNRASKKHAPIEDPKKLAAAFACAVTAHSAKGGDWVARNGEESLFSTLRRILPQASFSRPVQKFALCVVSALSKNLLCA